MIDNIDCLVHLETKKNKQTLQIKHLPTTYKWVIL